jgi:hypothetical protein
MLSSEEKRSRLEKALALGGDTHTLADVVQLIRDGKAQYWEHGDGTVITELHDFPCRKAVHYWLVSGRLRDCLALEHDVNPWAIEQGCTVATAVGRRGWLGPLGKTGWRAAPTLNLWKPLTLEGESHGRE